MGKSARKAEGSASASAAQSSSKKRRRSSAASSSNKRVRVEDDDRPLIKEPSLCKKVVVDFSTDRPNQARLSKTSKIKICAKSNYRTLVDQDDRGVDGYNWYVSLGKDEKGKDQYAEFCQEVVDPGLVSRMSTLGPFSFTRCDICGKHSKGDEEDGRVRLYECRASKKEEGDPNTKRLLPEVIWVTEYCLFNLLAKRVELTERVEREREEREQEREVIKRKAEAQTNSGDLKGLAGRLNKKCESLDGTFEYGKHAGLAFSRVRKIDLTYIEWVYHQKDDVDAELSDCFARCIRYLDSVGFKYEVSEEYKCFCDMPSRSKEWQKDDEHKGKKFYTCNKVKCQYVHYPFFGKPPPQVCKDVKCHRCTNVPTFKKWDKENKKWQYKCIKTSKVCGVFVKWCDDVKRDNEASASSSQSKPIINPAAVPIPDAELERLSRDQLQHWPVNKIKATCISKGLDTSKCVEKNDLVLLLKPLDDVDRIVPPQQVDTVSVSSGSSTGSSVGDESSDATDCRPEGLPDESLRSMVVDDLVDIRPPVLKQTCLDRGIDTTSCSDSFDLIDLLRHLVGPAKNVPESVPPAVAEPPSSSDQPDVLEQSVDQVSQSQSQPLQGIQNLTIFSQPTGQDTNSQPVVPTLRGAVLSPVKTVAVEGNENAEFGKNVEPKVSTGVTMAPDVLPAVHQPRPAIQLPNSSQPSPSSIPDSELPKSLARHNTAPLPQQMQQEQQDNLVFTVGKYRGRGFADIEKTDESYCKWVLSLENPSGCLLLCAQYLKQSGFQEKSSRRYSCPPPRPQHHQQQPPRPPQQQQHHQQQQKYHKYEQQHHHQLHQLHKQQHHQQQQPSLHQPSFQHQHVHHQPLSLQQQQFHMQQHQQYQQHTHQHQQQQQQHQHFHKQQHHHHQQQHQQHHQYHTQGQHFVHQQQHHHTQAAHALQHKQHGQVGVGNQPSFAVSAPVCPLPKQEAPRVRSPKIKTPWCSSCRAYHHKQKCPQRFTS